MSLKMLLAAFTMSLAAGGLSLAQDPPLPIPETAPLPKAGTVIAQPVSLYHRVKYDDRDEMAPCPVSMVVAVADPCNSCCCRYVEICVPSNCACPPRIACSRCGTKITYDYGKYSVEIKSKRDYVEVEYHD